MTITPNTANAKRRNSLQMGDRMRIADWFKTHQAEIVNREMTKEEVARWVGNDLDLYVTGGNLNSIIGQGRDQFVDFAWPKSRSGATKSVRQGQLRLIFEMVEQIRNEIGVIPNGEQATLWCALGDQLGVDTFKIKQLLEVRD